MLDPDEDIPADFIDPINQELMTDPVMVSDGRTYERTSIQNWILTKQRTGAAPTSPFSESPLAHRDLHPNIEFNRR